MKNWRRVIRFIIVVIFLVGSVALIAYLQSPHRAFKKIVQAMETRNFDLVYQFILDEEKEFGISKETIQRVLEDILYRNAPVVKAIPPPILRHISGKRLTEKWPFWSYPPHYRFYIGWANGVTGKPLPSSRPKVTGGILTLQIELYRPPKRGWQMSFTKLALTYIALNYPKEEAIKITPQMFKRWGIKAIYETPPYSIVRNRIHYHWDKPRWRKVEP